MEKTSLLLIDDERKVIKEWKNHFKPDKYDIYDAKSGEEALSILKHIRKKKGHLIVLAVLLDVQMDGLDGLEVLERIKGDFPFSIVYIITGNVDEENVPETAFKAGKLGGEAFFKKSRMRYQVLVEKLDEAVELEAKALSIYKEML